MRPSAHGGAPARARSLSLCGTAHCPSCVRHGKVPRRDVCVRRSLRAYGSVCVRADACVILTHTCPNAHSHAHCSQMVRLEEASTLGWGRARSPSPGKSSNDRVRPERLPDRLIRPLALVLILVLCCVLAQRAVHSGWQSRRSCGSAMDAERAADSCRAHRRRQQLSRLWQRQRANLSCLGSRAEDFEVSRPLPGVDSFGTAGTCLRHCG